MTATARTSNEPALNNNPRIFALLSLGLLLAAVLVPILIAAFGRPGFAFAFGAMAALLALLFGVLGWGDRIGRTVAVTLLSVLIVGGGGSVIIRALRSQHWPAPETGALPAVDPAKQPATQSDR